MREELIQQIVGKRVTTRFLWASLFTERGDRLLELKTEYSHVREPAQVAFGTTRGVHRSRQTHAAVPGSGQAHPPRQKIGNLSKRQQSAESSYHKGLRSARGRLSRSVGAASVSGSVISPRRDGGVTLASFLENHGLERLEGKLRSIGVTSPRHLQRLEEPLLATANMRPAHLKKLRRAIRQLA